MHLVSDVDMYVSHGPAQTSCKLVVSGEDLNKADHSGMFVWFVTDTFEECELVGGLKTGVYRLIGTR